MIRNTAAVRKPRATRRDWIGLAVIALPCLLYSMDLTVLYLAVPRISAALQPTSSQLLWITDIYGFLLAGSLITMGVLGDRIGRRKLLLIGAAIFGLFSILAAFSTSPEMLIATRALLGIAAATLAPSTLSLIRNMFLDSKQRTFAIGVWVASFSAGAAIGPLLGGLLLERFWWGSVFLLAVPAMALLLVLGPKLLPEFRDPKPGRLDLLSAALSLVSVLAIIYGLKEIAQNGLGWSSILSILVGFAVGAVFIRRQQQLSHPMIDLRLFRVPSFSASLAVNTIGFFVVFGASLFIAQYLQLVLGLSPLQAGLWTVPEALGFIAGSMLAPVFSRRLRPAFVMSASLGTSAIGFGLLTFVHGSYALAIIVTGSFVYAVGLAVVATLTSDLIVSSAPPERAGMASGLSETSSEFGGALGIAILGSIATAAYRNEVFHTLPTDIPQQVAGVAKDTLGGALAVAGQLPDRLGSEIIISARTAFANASVLVFVICVVITVATAVVTVALRRQFNEPVESD